MNRILALVCSACVLGASGELRADDHEATTPERSGWLLSASVGLSSQHGGLGLGVDAGTERWAIGAGVSPPPLHSAFYWAVGARVYILARPRKWAPFALALGGVFGDWTESRNDTVDDSGVVHFAGVALAVDHDIGDPNGFVLTYGAGIEYTERFPDKVLNAFPDDDPRRKPFEGGWRDQVHFALSYRFAP